MSKHNYFVTFLKKINLSINSLLEKYLNKLKFSNLLNITRSNKVFLYLIIVIILFISYLSIPHVHNKLEVKKELENQLLEKFNLDFNFSNNIKYNFFPRPHYIIENSFIFEDQLKISDIENLHILISLNNFFSLKNIVVKDVIIENATFNINQKNSNFFLKILDSNFSGSSLIIEDSNIFFKNIENQVLFINKIINMKYKYNLKELKNIVVSKNEIFNIPYFFSSYKEGKKKIFSKINLNFLKLQIKNELNYNNDKKEGKINFIYDRNKSEATYELNKNKFVFNYLEKLSDPKFKYRGIVNFNPFTSDIKGKTKKLDLSNLLNPNLPFVQLLKMEMFYNKNLNIEFSLNADQINKYQNFINIFFNSKVQEGLIDINKTKFSWNNYADFEILNSLLYVNQNELILDGKLSIKIKDYNKIYRFLQISKNLRPELVKIEFDFNYNFDEKILNSNNIKINNKSNKKVNEVLKKIFFKKDNLQNKIYLKNLIKKAIDAYVG